MLRKVLSIIWIVALSGPVCADDGAMLAELQRLEAENQALRAELAALQADPVCGTADPSTTGALMEKLATQALHAANQTYGLTSRLNVVPEALLRSVVPDEYLVLTDDTDAVIARLGLTPDQVIYRYDLALAGFAARLTRSERLLALADPDVRAVADNGRIFAAGQALGGLQVPLHQADTPLPDPGGTVDVYLFDTGVRASHSALRGRVVQGGFSAFENGIATQDCSGHGTHVAGLVAGEVYGETDAARLISVKVMNSFGAGDVATVIAGVDWVLAQTSQRPQVVNMSLTRLESDPDAPLDLAVQALLDSGVVVVVAAGNGAGDVADYSPARVPGAITVGSAADQELSHFTNAGAGVDIYAPGEDILSASILGTCSAVRHSGTSMAAPRITGRVVELLAAGMPAD